MHAALFLIKWVQNRQHLINQTVSVHSWAPMQFEECDLKKKNKKKKKIYSAAKRNATTIASVITTD